MVHNVNTHNIYGTHIPILPSVFAHPDSLREVHQVRWSVVSVKWRDLSSVIVEECVQQDVHTLGKLGGKVQRRQHVRP